MNGRGSRAKGKAAEREVAALCAEWWGQLEPGCKFASTPGSGGWSTAQMRAAFRVAGDLSTTALRWPFTVEVKRREGWDEGRLLAGRKSPVWGWWGQACKAAAEEGKQPMLWMRRSREPWSVMLPRAMVLLDWGIAVVEWARIATAGMPATPPPCMVAWEGLSSVEPALVEARAKGGPPYG